MAKNDTFLPHFYGPSVHKVPYGKVKLSNSLLLEIVIYGWFTYQRLGFPVRKRFTISNSIALPLLSLTVINMINHEPEGKYDFTLMVIINSMKHSVHCALPI